MERLSQVLGSLVAACVLMSSSAAAFDQPFLPLGADAKVHAGAGAVTSSGAASLLYNPANLSVGKAETEVYGELSIMHLSYAFSYPGVGSTKVETTTPIPLTGMSLRLGSRWTLGVTGLVAPADAAKTKADAVPSRQLGDDPVLLDMEIGGGKSASYLLAVGAAWRPTSYLAVGLTLATYHVYSDLEITDHESGQTVGGIDADVERRLAEFGLRLRPFKFLAVGVAADFEHKTEIHVEGKNDDGERDERAGRRGGRERLGVEAAAFAFRPFIEVQNEHHSRDRGDPFDLNPDVESHPSVVDTMNLILGSSLDLGRRNALVAAYGHYPSPLGDGVMADRSADGVERQGVSFGKLDGVTRDVFSIGFRSDAGFGRWLCGASHHEGRRSVPETSRGYGDYALKVSYVGCEFGFGL